MDVLVSQHFVGDPVEDVEYKKAQGEDRSGYGVNALGPVHKTLVKYLPIEHGNGRWRREHGGSFHGGPVLGLQAVTQSITPEVKATALPHQFLLLWSQAQGKHVGVVLSAKIRLRRFPFPLRGWFPRGCEA